MKSEKETGGGHIPWGRILHREHFPETEGEALGGECMLRWLPEGETPAQMAEW